MLLSSARDNYPFWKIYQSRDIVPGIFFKIVIISKSFLNTNLHTLFKTKIPLIKYIFPRQFASEFINHLSAKISKILSYVQIRGSIYMERNKIRILRLKKQYVEKQT